MVKEFIGFDYTGCIVTPRKTSLKRLVEMKTGKNADKIWKDILHQYGKTYGMTCHEHGEDAALVEFYNNLASLDIYLTDFEELALVLKREGLIRTPIMNAILVNNNKNFMIVTKNLTEEVNAFNDSYCYDEKTGLYTPSNAPFQAIVGTKGNYDESGKLIGVNEIIGDHNGEVNGIPRIQKIHAVNRASMGKENLAGYVTDTGDLHIRQQVLKDGGVVVVTKNFVSYGELDEYFQISADPNTGEYQHKIMADGVWNASVNASVDCQKPLESILSS